MVVFSASCQNLFFESFITTIIQFMHISVSSSVVVGPMLKAAVTFVVVKLD